jgi:hypothetical protein
MLTRGRLPRQRVVEEHPTDARGHVATTKLLLVTGDELEIAASVDEVVKELENAQRSSAGTLARLTQAVTGEPVALNSTHVVAVRVGDASGRPAA